LKKTLACCGLRGAGADCGAARFFRPRDSSSWRKSSLKIADPGNDRLTIDGAHETKPYNIFFHNRNGALEISDLAVKAGYVQSAAWCSRPLRRSNCHPHPRRAR
jgi:hypothetical protein